MNWEAVISLIPDAVDYVVSLVKLFKGDVEAARANIKSRKAEVDALRAQVDQALVDKHG